MTAVDRDDPRLIKVPFEEAARTKGGLVHNYINHWWVTVDGCVVFWSPTARADTYLYPQCNRDEATTRFIFDKMYPWGEVKQIPIVCVVYRER